MKRLVITCSVVMVILAWSNAALAEVQSSSSLPPTMGVYVSPQFGPYPQNVTLGLPICGNFTGVVRAPVGSDEQHTFNCQMDANVVVGGIDQGTVTMTGAMTVMVSSYTDGWTGTFATEIVSMSLSGVLPIGPIQIREGALRASTGQTTITNLGGGLYDIDSFFDVFTELSVDGGATWQADQMAPARLTLVPEPATLCLVGLGALAVLRRRRR